MRRRAATCSFITLKSPSAVLPHHSATTTNASRPREFTGTSQSLTRAKPHPPASVISITGECGSRVPVVVAGGEQARWRDACRSVGLGFSGTNVSHEGERPMAIRWRACSGAIPGAFYPQLAVAQCEGVQ